MKVRLLKDWNYRKSGEVVDVFEPTAKDWIMSGIAEEPVEERAVKVEQAVSRQPEIAERAVRKHSPARKSP